MTGSSDDDDDDSTILVSAGGNPGQQAPAGVPVDITLDIFSPNVVVTNMTIRHPQGIPTKRDVGVFVRPPATNVTVKNLTVERLRTGSNLEPTTPGSRGMLVFRATGTLILDNLVRGNYEDHIHLPTSGTIVNDNEVENATRIGIVVIQESAISLSVNNIIKDNEIYNSGTDGVQIQGDNNVVLDNTIVNSGGYGVHLCGSGSGCVAPGAAADASENFVIDNELSNNTLGNIGNFGTNNTIIDNNDDDD